MPDGQTPFSLVTDYDRDSIHTVPLHALPLQNTVLRQARLIKNVGLDARIELYRDKATGSGQIGIAEIPNFFNGSGGDLSADMAVLLELEKLPSFDCYSLRRGVRRAGISLECDRTLSLSAGKVRELFPLMHSLTRPLLQHLYGGEVAAIGDLNQLMDRLGNPGRREIRARLVRLAAALDVPVRDVPDLLADYGDVFLSLSYYRSYFVHATPRIADMLAWMDEISAVSFIRQDRTSSDQLRRISQTLKLLQESVKLRFHRFENNIEIDWDKMTLNTFNKVRALILAHGESLAEVLCGLTVKIYEWEEKFPNGGGSPERRLEFIRDTIKPGPDRLWRVERGAPQFT